eukprot:454999-Prorocentrum_lima.AAC.1
MASSRVVLPPHLSLLFSTPSSCPSSENTLTALRLPRVSSPCTPPFFPRITTQRLAPSARTWNTWTTLSSWPAPPRLA